MTFQQLFASKHYVVLSDRRVNTYSTQRICVATEEQWKTRCHFLQHLRAFGRAMQTHSRRCGDFLLRLAGGQHPGAPALQIAEHDKKGWRLRPLRRSDLVQLAAQIGLDTLNEARHFWFNALLDAGVPQVAIDAHLGHHLPGAEPFGFASGISMRELCSSLSPTLARIQRELGFEPLVGLGQATEKRLRLPEMPVPEGLKPLPNKFLARKVLAQEFHHVKEVGVATQDAPSTAQTLLAFEAANRLRSAFLHQTHTTARESKKRHEECPISRSRHGALLWCLVVEELVLTVAETKALYNAAISDGIWAIENMVVVEANHDSKPAVQRIVSRHTAAAAERARAAPDPCGFGDAVQELHHLVRALDPAWPAKTATATLDLLRAVMSHWAAVQIPAGVLVPVLHKAPFICAHDIARMRFGRARVDFVGIQSVPPPRVRVARTEFADVLSIVDHWADRDEPEGEEDNRSSRLNSALETHLSRIDIDGAERTLVDILRADLSDNPPYARLKVTTLQQRSRGYALFCSILRRENITEPDAEVYEEAFIRMGGSSMHPEESGHPRWTLLHLCAFFDRRGCWVPSGFLDARGVKEPRLPRLPVYTTRAEVDAACSALQRMYANQGGTFAFGSLLLRLWRSCGPRYSELRYAVLPDVDAMAHLLHITSTGHDHLKTYYSRGSLTVPDECWPDLIKLTGMREPLAPRTRSLLFGDSHSETPYAAFDQIIPAIHEIMAGITGCPHFRGHDLRAAAATDVAFNVEAEIERLCTSGAIARVTTSAAEIERLHRRFAAAARLARHATPLTTLRYYICSGLLDLRRELDKSHAAWSAL